MNIRFGKKWELRKLDSRNWELYHLRASSRGFGDGSERWASVGRYYQYNTIDNALRYAADVELKERRTDEAATIAEALDEWRGILDGFLADVRDALGGEAS